MNKKYIIQDWAGNILNFKGRIERLEFAVAMKFETWDDAEEYLSIKLADSYDEDRQEYFIVEGV